MAKAKEAKEPEVIEPEQVTDLANPEDVMSFLNRTAEADYEPSFTKIKVNHGSATFTSPGFGSGGKIVAVILAAPKVRALWDFDEHEDVAEWLGGLPICSSRGDDARNGIGRMTKVIDNEAPDVLKALVSPILEADYSCDQCKWSEYGSVPGQRGQACKQCIRLLVFNPESGVAGTLSVTPTSLSSWRDYKAGLPGQHYSAVITEISLNEQQRGKYHWSTMKFSMVSEITPEAIQKLSKKVTYKGKEIFEAKALISEFLQMPLDKEEIYPDTDEGGDDF